VTQFVNPYTFVPHATTVQRGEPAGHAAMGPENVSGFLSIRLTARTPLLIGGFGRPEEPDVPRRARDRKVIVPGSGLMGAVRSLHETLAGGCLRVLDTEWVPVHRHPASTAYTQNLKLAVVTRVKGGQATEVRLCEEWVWVPAELLPREDGRLPCTGDQVQYQPVRGKVLPLPSGAIGGAVPPGAAGQARGFLRRRHRRWQPGQRRVHGSRYPGLLDPARDRYPRARP
jgi:hypothetical protein